LRSESGARLPQYELDVPTSRFNVHVTGPGTFPLTTAGSDDVELTFMNGRTWRSGESGTSASTVTVSALTATGVTGTFSLPLGGSRVQVPCRFQSRRAECSTSGGSKSVVSSVTPHLAPPIVRQNRRLPSQSTRRGLQRPFEN
jgi:hypothetical protein